MSAGATSVIATPAASVVISTGSAGAVRDAATGSAIANVAVLATIEAVRAVLGRADCPLAPVAADSIAVGPALLASDNGATAVNTGRFGVIEPAGVGLEETLSPAPVAETLGGTLAACVHTSSLRPGEDQGVGVVAVLTCGETVIVAICHAGHTVTSGTDIAGVLAVDVATGIERNADPVIAFGSRRTAAQAAIIAAIVSVDRAPVVGITARDRPTGAGEAVQDHRQAEE